MIARKNAVFPPRCIKCNVPVEGEPKKRSFAWHHPGFIALLLINIVVYAIVALCVQKKGTIYYYACRRHRRQRTLGFLTGWFGGIGGFVTIIAGAVNSSGWIALAGAVIFIAGIIGGFMSRHFYPKKINDYFLCFRGGGPEFAASFFEVPAPQTLPAAYPYDVGTPVT